MKRIIAILLLITITVAHAMQPQQQSIEQRQEEFLKILKDGSFADTKSMLEKGGANASQPLFDFGTIAAGNIHYRGLTPLQIVLQEHIENGQVKNVPQRHEKVELLLSRGANKSELNQFLLAAARHAAQAGKEAQSLEEFRWLIARRRTAGSKSNGRNN